MNEHTRLAIACAGIALMSLGALGLLLQRRTRRSTVRSRLWMWVQYEGPWERLQCWLLKIDRRTFEIQREVRDGGARSRLADWADSRDRAWREGHLRRGTQPSRHWQRQGRDV